jgi:hypothetical protein
MYENNEKFKSKRDKTKQSTQSEHDQIKSKRELELFFKSNLSFRRKKKEFMLKEKKIFFFHTRA